MNKMFAMSMFAVLAIGAAASADIIKMKDGRQFEGQVISDDASVVSIKTMIRGVYTELDLNKSSVDSIEKKDLPANFFTPPPAKPKQIKEGKYLLIPFVGRIGDQIIPLAITQTLAQASSEGVEHVVFMVDSQGGDVDSSRDVVNAILPYVDSLQLHAIVRDASGTAMVVPILCKTVHLLPGAIMGGQMLTFDADKLPAGKTEQLMRAEIGLKIGRAAANRGWNGDVVRAMFDPEFMFSLCKTPDGKMASLVRSPVASDGEVIYQPGKGKTLTLTRDQAAALGMGSKYEGSDVNLGKALNIPNWEKYSNFGEDAMRTAAENAYMQQQKAVAAAEEKTRKLDDQRDQLKSYIQANLAEAKSWDPTADLVEYQKWAAAGDVDNRVVSNVSRGNTFTDRADVTLAALKRAQQGITQLKPLETQAATLGLKPLYKSGELDTMAKSISDKILYLSRERQRQSKIVSY